MVFIQVNISKETKHFNVNQFLQKEIHIPITAMAEGRSKGNLSEPCQISKMEHFEKVFNG